MFKQDQRPEKRKAEEMTPLQIHPPRWVSPAPRAFCSECGDTVEAGRDLCNFCEAEDNQRMQAYEQTVRRIREPKPKPKPKDKGNLRRVCFACGRFLGYRACNPIYDGHDTAGLCRPCSRGYKEGN